MGFSPAQRAEPDLGWYECLTDVSTFNADNENKERIVVQFNEELGYCYLDQEQRNESINDGEWFRLQRMQLEFFVNVGHYENNDPAGRWITDHLYAFILGKPTFLEWKECAEPEYFSKRVEGTSHMIVWKDE